MFVRVVGRVSRTRLFPVQLVLHMTPVDIVCVKSTCECQNIKLKRNFNFLFDLLTHVHYSQLERLYFSVVKRQSSIFIGINLIIKKRTGWVVLNVTLLNSKFSDHVGADQRIFLYENWCFPQISDQICLIRLIIITKVKDLPLGYHQAHQSSDLWKRLGATQFASGCC